ncbi:FecR domain-containing protein [Sphingobacterium sp. N143]|uniref:FecR family protein n=1 Tax=Sphingobacterium sp. N143 TaxID=2746727 RepID=UPI002578BFAA|nr:FecR family protein [Sphingobacterium sp. N143]MDM1294215.1 FecR domain-containing protein [Sphingobacterium sp. N143]
MEYNNRLKFLLEKYLSEQISSKEYTEFVQLVEGLEQQQLYDLYDEIKTTDPFFEETEVDYDHEGVLESIYGEITSLDKTKASSTSLFHWPLVSAVAAILMFFIGKELFVVPAKVDHISQVTTVDSSISLLDSSGVMLRLADGHVVDVKQNGQSLSYVKNGYHIGLTADGGIRYAAGSRNAPPDHQRNDLNIFSTERGAMSNIVLEDGTRVWLNSASSLKFPRTFSGEPTRTVEVVGEAYFEVAHNPKQPFVVVSDYSRVTVLGTKFNVKAYPDQSDIQTTLLQGAIRINSAKSSSLLIPGEQAVIKKSGKINLSMVNVDDFIAWKSGLIHFNNLTIEEIIIELSRWYDIRGIANISDNHERYTGSLNKNKKITEILTQLEKISNIHFKVKERRIIIGD